MKKIIIAICVLVLCISAVGGANWLFGNIGGPVIDYNGCTAYSKEDIDSAAQVVIDKVDSMEGCVLFSLKYSAADELEHCRELNPDADYAECIVFQSAFRSPLKSRFGAWNANRLYTWDWYLAREEGGPWDMVTEGYASKDKQVFYSKVKHLFVCCYISIVHDYCLFSLFCSAFLLLCAFSQFPSTDAPKALGLVTLPEAAK